MLTACTGERRGAAAQERLFGGAMALRGVWYLGIGAAECSRPARWGTNVGRWRPSWASVRSRLCYGSAAVRHPCSAVHGMRHVAQGFAPPRRPRRSSRPYPSLFLCLFERWSKPEAPIGCAVAPPRAGEGIDFDPGVMGKRIQEYESNIRRKKNSHACPEYSHAQAQATWWLTTCGKRQFM